MSNQEFKMVEAATAAGLEEGVDLMLSQGWLLHGVTMMATEPAGIGRAGVTCRFVQALVRSMKNETASRVREFLAVSDDRHDDEPMWIANGIPVTWHDLRILADYVRPPGQGEHQG